MSELTVTELLIIKGDLNHNDDKSDKYKDILRVVKYNSSVVLEKASYIWNDEKGSYQRSKNKTLNKADLELIHEKYDEIMQLF